MCISSAYSVFWVLSSLYWDLSSASAHRILCEFKVWHSASAQGIMLGSPVVSLPHKNYTATWRSAVPLPHKSFGVKSRSSAFAHRILCDLRFCSSASIHGIPRLEPLIWICIVVTVWWTNRFPKQFSCYIFWSACLVFSSKQEKHLLKIMNFFLLRTQIYTAS